MAEFQNLDEMERTTVWLDANKAQIYTILETALKKEIAVRKKLEEQGVDVYGHRPFRINPNDVYSNPFCNKLLEEFPQDALWYVDVGRSGVTVGGKRYSYHVYFRTFGGVVIDPTVGQFIDLDKAKKEHKDFFQDRILVANREDAKRALGIEYPETFENSILT